MVIIAISLLLAHHICFLNAFDLSFLCSPSCRPLPFTPFDDEFIQCPVIITDSLPSSGNKAGRIPAKMIAYTIFADWKKKPP